MVFSQFLSIYVVSSRSEVNEVGTFFSFNIILLSLIKRPKTENILLSKTKSAGFYIVFHEVDDWL